MFIFSNNTERWQVRVCIGKLWFSKSTVATVMNLHCEMDIPDYSQGLKYNSFLWKVLNLRKIHWPVGNFWCSFKFIILLLFVWLCFILFYVVFCFFFIFQPVKWLKVPPNLREQYQQKYLTSMTAHFQPKLKEKLGKQQTLRSSEHQAQNAVLGQGTCKTSLNDDNNTHVVSIWRANRRCQTKIADFIPIELCFHTLCSWSQQFLSGTSITMSNWIWPVNKSC